MKPHQNQKTQKRFLIALVLTGVIFAAEVIGGVVTGSLALLSDSAHVFTDLFALLLSYLAMRVSARPADDRHTFGFHRYEVLAALINGVSLGIISFGIYYEAVQRFLSPPEIKSGLMLIISSIGLVVNIIVAILLGLGSHTHEDGSHHTDLNLRSAFLHVLGDAISSVGVIIAALVIQFTGAVWVDSIASILIGTIILAGSYRIIRSAGHILIEGVPEGLELKEVSASMQSMVGVKDIHDLHIWNICSGHIALSAHILIDPPVEGITDHVSESMNTMLKEKFHIAHTTFQVETRLCTEDSCI